MKLYQKLESATYDLYDRSGNFIEFFASDGFLGVKIGMEAHGVDVESEMVLDEEKLIQLRNFLNSLLGEA
jgi:hypothetical protein